MRILSMVAFKFQGLPRGQKVTKYHLSVAPLSNNLPSYYSPQIVGPDKYKTGQGGRVSISKFISIGQSEMQNLRILILDHWYEMHHNCSSNCSTCKCFKPIPIPHLFISRLSATELAVRLTSACAT